VGPPGGALLDQAYGTSRAGALFDRELRTQFHDFIVSPPECQVQKTHRIEERVGRLVKGFQHDLLRDLGCLRAIGMATHSVDHDQQRRMLANCRGDPILVLLAPPQEADVGVVDPQEEFHVSVRLM